jgi:vancomycin resistance protein VanJ
MGDFAMAPEQTSPLSIRLLLAAWHACQAAILLYGLAVTSYLIARLAVGERWDTVAYANNFIPWWALGGAILVGIGLLSSRRWLLVGVQLPGILAFALLYGDLLWPTGAATIPSAEPDLTAATYNIISSTSNPQRVTDVIAALDADLVGIQELGPAHAEKFALDLAGRYPYQALHPGLPVHGVGLLSRYPIVEEEVIRPLPDSMLYLRAVVDLDGKPITVYVVHPPPPQRVLTPISYDDARRDTEIAILHDTYLQNETGPLLVMGDFNMSDQSDAYRQMDALLHDAFREVGHGLGFTFPDQIKSRLRLIPLLLRIDYVWYNDHFFTVWRAYVGADGGTSDHRPVVAELSLQGARAAIVQVSD